KVSNTYNLKDHKDNFSSNPTCRLINPTKSEIGKVSKCILDRINKDIINKTGVKQWKSTIDTLNWFNSINGKKHTQIFQPKKKKQYGMQSNLSYTTATSHGPKRILQTHSMLRWARLMAQKQIKIKKQICKVFKDNDLNKGTDKPKNVATNMLENYADNLNLSSRKRSCVYQYGLVLITTCEYINNINDCSNSTSNMYMTNEHC
ncbi:Hypothetical predicted protein, partial [Paramuricea clavata]